MRERPISRKATATPGTARHADADLAPSRAIGAPRTTSSLDPKKAPYLWHSRIAICLSQRIILPMALPSPLIFTSLKNLPAGRYLKTVRERLGMGFQDVQDASAIIAAEEKSDQFFLSVARLFQIENELTTPSAFKILTLSAVYGLDYYDLLRRYGIDPDRVHHLWSLVPHRTTHLVSMQVHGSEAKVRFPLRVEPEFPWETTQLINRVVRLWGELPVTLLAKLNHRKYLFGYVGLQDQTMSPLLRPGTIVMIDGKRRRVTSEGWQDEFARPIYFVELRDAYRCAWCQLESGKLTLIPHPLSPVRAKTFNYPDDAEILGQVVGIVMRLAPPESECPAL
jgi:hypothetical protein